MFKVRLNVAGTTCWYSVCDVVTAGSLEAKSSEFSCRAVNSHRPKLYLLLLIGEFCESFKTCLPASLVQSGSITFVTTRNAVKSTIQSKCFVTEADDRLCLQLHTVGLRQFSVILRLLYDSSSNSTFLFHLHISFNSRLHIRSRRVFWNRVSLRSCSLCRPRNISFHLMPLEATPSTTQAGKMS